jgi:hypothetical protein
LSISTPLCCHIHFKSSNTVASTTGKIYEFRPLPLTFPSDAVWLTDSLQNCLFGKPTSYVKLCIQDDDALETAMSNTNQKFKFTMHKFLFSNCHSYVSDILNGIQFNGRRYSMFDIMYLKHYHSIPLQIQEHLQPSSVNLDTSAAAAMDSSNDDNNTPTSTNPCIYVVNSIKRFANTLVSDVLLIYSEFHVAMNRKNTVVNE